MSVSLILPLERLCHSSSSPAESGGGSRKIWFSVIFLDSPSTSLRVVSPSTLLRTVSPSTLLRTVSLSNGLSNHGSRPTSLGSPGRRSRRLRRGMTVLSNCHTVSDGGGLGLSRAPVFTGTGFTGRGGEGKNLCDLFLRGNATTNQSYLRKGDKK
jgi:hypothetical protein